MSKSNSKTKAAGRLPASGKKAAAAGKAGRGLSAGKAHKTSAAVKTARTPAKPAHRAVAKRPGQKRAAAIRQAKPTGRHDRSKVQRPSPTRAAAKAKPRVVAPVKAAKAKQAPPKAPPRKVVANRPKTGKDQPVLKVVKTAQAAPAKPVKPAVKPPVKPMTAKAPIAAVPAVKPAAAPIASPERPLLARPETVRPPQPHGKRPMPMRPHLLSGPPRPHLHGPMHGMRPGQPALAPKLPGHAQVVVKQSPALALKNAGFATGDFVVYPTHGVGRIIAVENQQIAGHDLQLFVINFEKDRMTLRVPVPKAHTSGLRRLSTRKEMQAALTKLRGRSRARRTMWSRRAQEYEAKINSGDPNSIAEVVRDLHRNAGQPDQSYSERQIYQAALDRLAREFAAIEKIDEQTAAQRLEQMLRAA